jgi:mono/diheme cytochrome c family protein
MKRRLLLAAMLVAPLLVLFALWVGVLVARQGGLAPFRVPSGLARSVSTDATVVERGRYLAALGNCAGCHTWKGGPLLAGGRSFRTDYGTIYSSNLTPDPEHGIGRWSFEEFAHAMRHGVSRNGVQSPVFPYASFRHLSDADLAALFAWLGTVPAVPQPRSRDNFDFPASLPGAMTAWRLLYYRPMPLPVPADADAPAARGAYLVAGIGHCATCHASRGTFASQAGGADLLGARNAGWHAPALHAGALARFAPGTLADYLRGGNASGFATYGRMADVVAGNLQHLAPADADAIEAYLRTLPAPPPPREGAAASGIAAASLEQGRALYAEQCADCHGERGEGEAAKYPALAASSAVASADPINLVKLILFGAVAPTTALTPSPYTMPPFAQALSADEVAALANYLRHQHDDTAAPVTAADVRAVGGID